MKITIIRLLSLLFAIAMLSSAFVGCSNEDGNNDNNSNNTAPASTTASAINTTLPEGDSINTTTSVNDSGDDKPKVEYDAYGRVVINPDIPSNLNYDREFVVHTRGNVEQYEWLAEKPNGVTLNDAIYDRNSAVENLLNIDIVVVAEGSWADYNSTTLPKIKANIKSGAHSYDLLAGFSTPISTLATSGLIYDLNEIQYIDFEKPWWNDSIVEKMTIADKTFFGVGSLSLSMIYSLECIIYNSSLLEIATAGMEGFDIFDCVNNGDWTWEKMVEIGSVVYEDSNGSQVKDDGDRFGIAFCDNTNTLSGFLCSSGLDFIDRDSNGDMILNVDVDKAHNVVGDLVKLLYKTECAYEADKTVLDFTDGNVLFFNHWLYYVQTYVSQKMNNYGILPMPKYSKDQDYCTMVQAGMHMYCIPVDVVDPEANGIITEALAAESYKTLVPTYYEICLKTRYSATAEASKMIDIVYNSAKFDIAYTFDSSIGCITMFTGMIKNKINVLSSVYDKQRTVIQSKIDDLVEGVLNPSA